MENPIIPAIIVAVVVIAFYIFKGRLLPGKKATSKPSEIDVIENKDGENVRARIYDASIRKAYCDDIPLATVDVIKTKYKNLGRKWLYLGEWVYALVKDDQGGYSPLVVTETMDFPPSSLHRALQQDAVTIFYDVTVEKSFIEQNWKYLLFAGVVIFLLWTLVAPKG